MAHARFAYRLSFPGFMLFTLLIAVISVAEPFFWAPNAYFRLAVAACLVALPWLAMQWTKVIDKAHLQHTTSQLKSLCETDLVTISQQGEVDWFDKIDKANPLMNCVAQTMFDHAQQFDEQEQARQGADIRARRVTLEKEQLSEVLKGLSDPLVAVNSYGQVLLANESFRELFGDKVLASSELALDKLIDCPPLMETLDAARRRRSSAIRTTEACIPTPEGRSRWYRATCRPISSTIAGNEAGQSGAVAVLTDITPQKLIQQRNAEFVAAVSHEMKTPLSSIKAYVELLADGEAEDEATRQEFLDVINGQTDRLKRLIDNLLNLARIEAGVVSVNKEPQSLNQILQEAFDVLRPAAEMKNITLVADLSPLYLSVHADRDTLLQAVINLISNAVKYTHNGGTVTLRSRSEDDSVCVEVQDTGVGLSEEDIQHVFEKFYRVKKDKDMAAGTGLGLPLVKHIVEDIHSGSIQLRSVLGTGSTFSIHLPQMHHTA